MAARDLSISDQSGIFLRCSSSNSLSAKPCQPHGTGFLRSKWVVLCCCFLPPPPLGSVGVIMFLCRPFPYVCVHLSMMVPWYLWCALMDLHQTFVSSASWDKDELVSFWGQRSKLHTAWPVCQQVRNIPWTRKGVRATVVTADHCMHAELSSGHALASCYSCCMCSLPGLC